MQGISLSTLSNGLRVCTDTMHGAESVIVSIGVRVGSRNECASNNGISHFLEHMAFKGTTKRTALQIAEEVDMIGGTMNAYTSKEITVYYIKLIKEHRELAFDVISDIICNSLFDLKEIEKERSVILQELAATLDSPCDVASEAFHDMAYKNDALGMSILGPSDNIKSFQKKDFIDYVNQHYYAENMVLGVCGNVEHSEVLDMAQKYFSGIKSKVADKNIFHAEYHGGQIIKNKDDLEQVQFILGMQAYSYKDDRYYTMHVLSDILGGGMSSRLFQEVRERRGLAYSVSAYLDCYCDVGMLCIYADVAPTMINNLVEAISGELKKVSKCIEVKELKKVFNQTKADLLMSRESSAGRGQKMIKNFLLHDRYIAHNEIINKIAAITIDDVIHLAQETLQNATLRKPTISVYGKVDAKIDLEHNFQNLA